MRLQAHLTKEHETAINALLESVNETRKRAGLEPANISFLVNEILARTFERTSVNLCNVFVTIGEPAIALKSARTASVPVSTLKWWRELIDLNPQDLAPRIDVFLAASEQEAQ